LQVSPYFDRQKFAYGDICCAPWRGIRARGLWDLCHHNSRGVVQAWRQLRRFAPTAVIGFGSYHTLPAMIAAWAQRHRLFLYEANTVPGKVNALFSRYATATAVQFPSAADLLHGPACHVAVHGRCQVSPDSTRRALALQHYGLEPHKPTVLISGGSQGALAVNTLAVAALTPSPYPLQVIHLAGHQAPIVEYSAAYQRHGITARVLPFEEQIEHAWAAADLFIGRAGAGTVAELLQARVPAILIPYPWSSDQHQEHNARFFTQKVGGGVLFAQHQLTAQCLHRAIAAALAENGLQRLLWSRAIAVYMDPKSLPSLEDAVIDFLME
jgi:UDP-N-acetylglucosamine--N-acetylmuramyl-(pentapeptide) pyrophosphoryl-undecaprenol N-acetylglucosamine transferase